MELYCPDRIGVESHPQRRTGSESHRTFKDSGYEQDAVPTFISVPFFFLGRAKKQLSDKNLVVYV